MTSAECAGDSLVSMAASASYRGRLATNSGARAFETYEATAPPATFLPALVGFFFSFASSSCFWPCGSSISTRKPAQASALPLTSCYLESWLFTHLALSQSLRYRSLVCHVPFGCFSFSDSPAVASSGVLPHRCPPLWSFGVQWPRILQSLFFSFAPVLSLKCLPR